MPFTWLSHSSRSITKPHNELVELCMSMLKDVTISNPITNKGLEIPYYPVSHDISHDQQ